MEQCIRATLSEAAFEKSQMKLAEAFRMIKDETKCDTAVQQGQRPIGEDLYVQCAELALELCDVDVAHNCLATFFHDYNGPPNQFLIRGYLAMALAVHIRGPESSDISDVEHMELAVSYILKGLEIARHITRYAFLVYNASVTYWRVVRLMLRDGSRTALLSSFSVIVDALNNTDDTDYEWRVQLLMNLTLCYEEANEFVRSCSTIDTAVKLAYNHVRKSAFPLFKIQIECHQRRLMANYSESEVIAEALNGLVKQFPGDGVEAGIVSTLEQLRKRNISDDISIEEELDEICYSTIDGKPSSWVSEAERAFLLMDIARLAMENGHIEIANRALGPVQNCNSQAARIQSEFLQCELLVASLGPKQEVYTSAMVETRVEALTRMERALNSACRLGDRGIVQAGCVAIWNLALPLLQSSLRSHTMCPLLQAADALESINSPLFLLRCQLHMEIAYCEEAEDLLAKAKNHISKAQALDRHGKYRYELEAAAHSLSLKTEIYQQVDHSEDQALLLVSQAKDCRNAGLREAMLDRAIAILAPDTVGIGFEFSERDTVLPIPRPGGERSAATRLDMDRAHVLAEISKTARRYNLRTAARKAAELYLVYSWDPQIPSHRTLLRLKAQMHVIRSETMIQMLQADDLRPGDDFMSIQMAKIEAAKDIACASDGSFNNLSGNGNELSDADLEELQARKDWVDKLSEDIMAGFLGALDIGKELGESEVTHNAVTYFWNYHRHCLEKGNYVSLLPALERVHNALVSEVEPSIPQLAQIANAYARALLQEMEQQHAAGNAELHHNTVAATAHNDASGAEAIATHASEKKKDKKGSKIVAEEHPNLRRALETCEHAFRFAKPAQRISLINTWMTIKMFHQEPVNLDVESSSVETRVLMMLELQQRPELAGLSNPKDPSSAIPTGTAIIALMKTCHFGNRLVEIEIWTKLALHALRCELPEQAIECGSSALALGKKKQLKKNQASKASTPEYVLLHIAARTMCQAVLNLIDPVKQDRSHKDKLRQRALGYLSEATRFAYSTGDYAMVIDAARLLWNTCLPFVEFSLTRKMLLRPIEAVLRYMAELDSKRSDDDIITDVELEELRNDTEMRMKMYKVIFQCYTDQNRCQNGLKAVEAAFAAMPFYTHKELWTYRIVFKCMMGRGVSNDMLKLKDEGQSTKAHVLRAVAKSSQEPSEQIAAYQDAIESLTEKSVQFVKAESLIEFGEWLFCNSFPIQDAIDQLESAADILIDMMEEKLIDAASTQATASINSLSSSCEESSSSLGRNRQSLFRLTRRESHSSLHSSIRSLHQAAPDFEDVIPPLGLNVQQLELLARLYVMLARMSTGNGSQLKDYCLLAHMYYMRIWETSIYHIKETSTNAVEKDGAAPTTKKSGTLERKRGFGSSAVLNTVDTTVNIDVSLPSSFYGWAQFELPQAVHQIFKDKTRASTEKLTISAHAMPKSRLVAVYLQMLIEQLQQLGYTAHCLPLISLMSTIAVDIIEDDDMYRLVQLQFAELCRFLHLYDAAIAHRDRAGDLTLSDEHRDRCREEVRQKCRQRSLVREGEMISNMNPASRTSSADSNQRKSSAAISSRRSDKILSNIKTRNVMQSSPSVSNIIAKKRPFVLSERHIWVRQAELLIREGLVSVARSLLYESQIHARIWEDEETCGAILLQLAKIAQISDRPREAVQLLFDARQLDGDFSYWERTTLLLSDCLIADGEQYSEAKRIIEHTIDVFKQYEEKHPTATTDCRLIQARFKARLGCIVVDMGLLRSPLVEVGEFEAGIRAFESAISMLFALGRQYEVIDVLLKFAEVELRTPATDTEDVQRHMLAARGLLQQAESEVMELLRDVRVLSDTGTALFLPVQRQAVRVKLALGNVETDILAAHLSSDANATVSSKPSRKFSINVEESIARFLHETPEPDSAVLGWEAAARHTEEFTLTRLSGALALADCVPDLALKVSYSLGRLLRILLHAHHPNANRWQVSVHGKGREELPFNLNEATTNDSSKEDSSSVIVNSNTLHIMAQAVQNLSNSVNMAIHERSYNEAAKASYELLLCYGVLEPSLSTKYLALYQSCLVYEKLMLLFHQTCRMSMSQPVEHLHIVQRDILSNPEVGMARTGKCQNLIESNTILNQSSPVCNMLTIDAAVHCSSIPSLPDDFRVIILQHSPDGRYLYASLLAGTEIPSLDSTASANGGGSTESKEASRRRRRLVPPQPIVVRIETSPNDLRALCQQYKQFKLDLERLLVRKFVSDNARARLKISTNASNTAVSPANDDPNAMKTSAVISDTITNTTTNTVSAAPAAAAASTASVASSGPTNTKGGKGKKISLSQPAAPPQSTEVDLVAIHAAAVEEKAEALKEIENEKEQVNAESAIEFSNIVTAFESYVGPALSQLKVLLEHESMAASQENDGATTDDHDTKRDHGESSTVPPMTDDNINGATATNVTQCDQFHFVVLLDGLLEQLPIEALSIFRGEYVASVSRDFSLQVLLNRLTNAKNNAETIKAIPVAIPVAPTKGNKNSKAAAPPVVPSNSGSSDKGTDGARNSDDSKMSSLHAIDNASIHYIVDPRNECTEIKSFEHEKPNSAFSNFLVKHKVKWNGVFGSEHTASIGEWQNHFGASSGFIFYGLNRMLSYLEPRHVASVDMRKCSVVFILDHMLTENSHRWQTKEDIKKSQLMLDLENSSGMSSLMTLRGVSSVFVNQFDTTIPVGYRLLNKVLGRMLSHDTSLAEALHLSRAPLPPPPEVPKLPEPEISTPIDPEYSEDQNSNLMNIPSSKSDKVDEKRISETNSSNSSPRASTPNPMLLDYTRYNAIIYGLPHLKLL